MAIDIKGVHNSFLRLHKAPQLSGSRPVPQKASTLNHTTSYSWVTEAPRIPGDHNSHPNTFIFQKKNKVSHTLTPICFANNFMRISLLYKPASFSRQVFKLWIWRIREGRLLKKKRIRLKLDRWKGARRYGKYIARGRRMKQEYLEAKSMGSVVCPPGYKSLLCQWLAVWPLTSHLHCISCLNFPTCKMWVMILIEPKGKGYCQY